MQSETQQVFSHVVQSRRSVRAFLPQAVTDEVLQKVFALAQTAPSNCNTQPWVVHVASGAVRNTLQKTLIEALQQGQFAMDFPYEGRYDGEYKARQYDAAAQLYQAMGIERTDKERRNAAFFKNFEFFDAPHVAFLFLPEDFGIREAADLGMYAQNLMLALTAFGLASCPQTALSFQADKVREILGVESSLKLLFGISFGFEYVAADANTARVGRAELAQVVKFQG